MKEIEKKFFVDYTKYKEYLIENKEAIGATHKITQGYLFSDIDGCVRIRKNVWKDTFDVDVPHYEITAKGKTLVGSYERDEYEMEIDPVLGEALLDHLENNGSGLIKKFRTYIGRWEIDQFLNPEFNGLIIAEYELENADEKITDMPDFIREEVRECDYKKYTNAVMIKKLEGKVVDRSTANEDELFTTFYSCPDENCGCYFILDDFKYCPWCGMKLKFDKKKEN